MFLKEGTSLLFVFGLQIQKELTILYAKVIDVANKKPRLATGLSYTISTTN